MEVDRLKCAFEIMKSTRVMQLRHSGGLWFWSYDAQQFHTCISIHMQSIVPDFWSLGQFVRWLRIVLWVTRSCIILGTIIRLVTDSKIWKQRHSNYCNWAKKSRLCDWCLCCYKFWITCLFSLKSYTVKVLCFELLRATVHFKV